MAIPSTFSKSGDGISDQFPAGLRVLVVDDDSLCLKILEKMLTKCLYQVTQCDRAEIALTFLRGNKNGFDIVLCDVHMPDMDGFKLLEQVGLEMDLPVIMMSADDSKNVVMKGVTHGACDYLIKPVRLEAVKNIWQHVIRKKKSELKDKDVEDVEQHIVNSSSENNVILKKSSRRDEDEDEDEDEDRCAPKKPRIVWSTELHKKFVEAVHRCDKVVPLKILELMNVPGLERSNVSSHLQKYRLYLKKSHNLRDDLQQENQNGINNSSYINMLRADLQQGNQYRNNNSPYIGMSSLHGIDFQAQPISQISGHNVAELQPLHRPSNISQTSIADQRNMFRFECPDLGQVDQMNLFHGIPTTMDPKHIDLGLSESDQMNLLHGIPTTTDPKQQLASLNQSNVSENLLLNGVYGTIYNPSEVDFSPLYDDSFPNTMNRGPSSLSLRNGLQDYVNIGSKRCVPGYYDMQRYDSHPCVQTSGHAGVGDGFNPKFGMPSDFDTQFTVESLQDASCPINNIFPQHLGEDTFFCNTLLQQKDVAGSENEYDAFPPRNNLLA